MKTSKSGKNISIVTDRKVQHDMLSQQQANHMKGSSTCINKISATPLAQIPMTCKNMTQQSDHPHRNSSCSAHKHRRQRSSSLQGETNWHEAQEQRKKQLDYLCLQKIVNIIKKFLIDRQERWNLQALCYGQLIQLLWICRFVSHSDEQEFIQNNEQTQLKKVYLLWVSIAVKKLITLKNYLLFVQVIQNISIEPEKLNGLIYSLQAQIQYLCLKPECNYSIDPCFTFFIKRMEVKRQGNQLWLSDDLKLKFTIQFKSFKLNKLKNTGVIECLKKEENQFEISKKSAELAQQKRIKMQQKIRQTKPQVETINLEDLLSYRQRDHYQNLNVQEILMPQRKCTGLKIKKSDMKKDIELLSRPKIHLEERKEDEVNYFKEEDQFTFHPRITSYKTNNQPVDKVLQVKNADKVLIRMREARKLKQEKQNILQKGWSNAHSTPSKAFLKSSSNKTSCQIRPEKQKQHNKNINKVSKYEVSKDYLRIPLLYIDVNIEEGKKQRIIIYDNDKAESLAQEFGIKHKLTQETIGRLEILLQQQMDTVLARIEEETEDDCSFLV